MINKLKTIHYYLLLLSIVMVLNSCQNMERKDNKSNRDSLEMMTNEHQGTILTEIPFAIAQNYFVKNDAQLPQDPKITTKSDFDAIFGNATLMGEDGKPTPIDFDQQFVIAVVLDQSDFATKIEPMDLTKLNTEKIQFRYTVTVGDREQFISQPALILIVDKKYEAAIVLKKEE